MRALSPFSVDQGSLIASYSEKLGEAIAVRRAAIAARAARAEAELTIKARSEFLANMNHELRTPLNAIIGFATMLRDSDVYQVTDEQRCSYAEYVLQSADLLLGHIGTILETAALDSGAVTVQTRNIDVAEALAEAMLRAQIAADAASVKLENRTKDDVSGWGDEQRLGQAVDHLLRCAIRASRPGSRVSVRTAVVRGWAEIAVRDRGVGYAPEEIEQALNVFDEVHRGLDRSFAAGPGVGLAIAKTFVEMQGGRFAIESRTGKGTVARILIPPPRAVTAPADENLQRLAS